MEIQKNPATNTSKELALDLINYLTSVSVEQAIKIPQSQQMSLVLIQNSQTLDKVQEATKIFLLDSELSLKLACAIIALFNSSIKTSSEKMNEIEIFETADLFIRKYTHESISDLMLCLKMIKNGELGIIYNRFDCQVLFEFFNKYLDVKYEKIENDYNSLKTELNGSVNTPFHTKMYQIEREIENKETQSRIREAKVFQQAYFENLKYLQQFDETT